MHFPVPVNRWTVGAVVLVLSIWGGDFIEPIFRAISILSAAHNPAI